MTVKNAVNWFEIPVNDMEKAKAFYEDVLGLTLSINEMGPFLMAWFPMHEGAEYATGSLIKGEGHTPSHAGTLVYFAVESIEAAVEKAESGGGKTVTPKMPIGEHGFVAHIEDCEGNRVGLHAMS